MHIRDATHGDLDAIVAMSACFYATTEYTTFADFDADSVRELAAGLVDNGIMLVAEHEGQVFGMAGLAVAPFLFNRSVTAAYEVVWWVNPGGRAGGAGVSLLKQIEVSARDKGCKAVQMVRLSSSPAMVDALYKRHGYRSSESCFTKVI